MERQEGKGGEGKKAERERKGEGSGGGGRGKGWYSGMKILATALRDVNSIYQFQLNFSLVSFHFLVTGAQRLYTCSLILKTTEPDKWTNGEST